MPPLPIRLRDQMQVGRRIGPVIPARRKPSAAADPILVSAAGAMPGEALQQLGDAVTPTYVGQYLGGVGGPVSRVTLFPGLSGAQPGDRMFACIGWGGGHGILKSPDDGWTQLATFGGSTAPTIWTRVCEDDEPDYWVWDWTIAQNMTAVLLTYRNVGSVQVVTRSDPGGSTNRVSPEIDVAQANAGLLLVVINTVYNVNPINLWTERFDNGSAGGSFIEAQDFLAAEQPPDHKGPFAFIVGATQSAAQFMLALLPPGQGGEAFISIESLAKVASTGGTPSEGGGSATQTSSEPMEALGGIRATAAEPAEALQALAATTAALPAEALQRLAATVAAASEYLQGIAATVAEPDEALGAVRATGTEPAEALQPVSAVGTIFAETFIGVSQTSGEPVESIGGVLASGGEPVESLEALSASESGPAESGVGVGQTASQPGEALEGVRATASTPAEALAQIQALLGLPQEAGEGLANSAILPADALEGLAALTAAPDEALAGLASTAVMPAEALELLDAEVAAPEEALQGIGAVAVVPVEAQGQVTFDVQALAAIPIEVLAGASLAATIPLEALGGVLGSVEAAVEALESLSVVVLIPVESGGGPGQAGIVVGRVIPAFSVEGEDSAGAVALSRVIAASIARIFDKEAGT